MDAGGSGAQQRPRALCSRRAGCQHIIHEQDRMSPQPVSGRAIYTEGVEDIGPALLPPEFGLRSGGSDPYEAIRQ